jgi:hypothetical protein
MTSASRLKMTLAKPQRINELSLPEEKFSREKEQQSYKHRYNFDQTEGLSPRLQELQNLPHHRRTLIRIK